MSVVSPVKAAILGGFQIKAVDGATSRKIIGLFYGPNGCGKTSLARDCHGPGGRTLLLACDANYGPLAGKKFVVDVETWEQFATAVERIPYDEFDTIAVDTVTQLIDLVQAHECRRLGVEHPS